MVERLHRCAVILAVSVMIVWIGGDQAFGGQNKALIAQQTQSESDSGTDDRIAAGAPGTGKVPESGITREGQTPAQKDSGPKVEQKSSDGRLLEGDAPGTGKIPESGIREDGRTPVQMGSEGEIKQRETIEPTLRGGAPGTGKVPESGISEDGQAPPEPAGESLRGYYLIPPEGSKSPESDAKSGRVGN